jgi:proline iminopeptidase
LLVCQPKNRLNGAMIDPTTQLYPEIEPYKTHMLDVGDGHTLYIEESGNPSGLPALVLHGGPGSGCKPSHRQRFDPSKWRIVCFDQRGCGRSVAPPEGPLHSNTTPHLVADCESIREHLKIPHWATLYGSSWGSTLAITYAQRHTNKVRSLCVSACFFPDEDFTWDWATSPTGLALFYPAAFAELRKLSPTAMGLTMIQDLTAQGLTAIQHMIVCHGLAADLATNQAELEAYFGSPHGANNALIQANFYSRRCDLTPGEQLANAHKLAHLPVFIQQGLQDMVCPPAGAYRLAEALRAADGNPVLEIIPACGHRGTPAMEAARVKALDSLATILLA